MVIYAPVELRSSTTGAISIERLGLGRRHGFRIASPGVEEKYAAAVRRVNVDQTPAVMVMAERVQMYIKTHDCYTLRWQRCMTPNCEIQGPARSRCWSAGCLLQKYLSDSVVTAT